MAGHEFSEMGGHIVAAREPMMAGRNCVLPHLRWELQQVLSRVRPQDLSAAEVAGLLGILESAHSRIVGGPTNRPGPGVRGVGGEDSASQLA